MRPDPYRLIVEPFLPQGQPGDPALATWLGSFTLVRLAVLVIGLAAVPPMLILRDLAAPLMPVVLTVVAVAALGLAGARFGRAQDALALTGTGMLVLAAGPWPNGISAAAAALATLALAAEWLAAPRAVRRAKAAGATLAVAAAAVIAASVLRQGSGVSAGPALVLLVLPLLTMARMLAAHETEQSLARALADQPRAPSAASLAAARSAVLIVNRQAEVSEATPAVGALLETGGEPLVDRDFLDRVLIADRPRLLKAVSDAAVDGVPGDVSVRLATGSRAARAGAPPVFVSLSLSVEPVAGSSDVAVILGSGAPAGQSGAAEPHSSHRLSAFAHDIRSPMNAILGFSAMLADHAERRQDVATVAEYGELIHTSANVVFAMTQTLIDSARLDAFDDQPAEPIDVAELLAGLMATHASRMRLDRASRSVSVTGQPADITTDPQAMRMLLSSVVEGLGAAAGRSGIVQALVAGNGPGITVTVTAMAGAEDRLSGSLNHLDLVGTLARRLASRLGGTFDCSLDTAQARIRIDLPAAPIFATLPRRRHDAASPVLMRKSA